MHYWDVDRAEAARRTPARLGVENVVAAPDGSVVYSVGAGVVREWDLNPATRGPRRLCTEAGRNLTRDEWDTYLGGESYRHTCP